MALRLLILPMLLLFVSTVWTQDEPLWEESDFMKGEQAEHFLSDDPQSSGEDELFIPVREKPHSKPETESEESEETKTEAMEVTSFKPVEFNFEHKYTVSTVHPDSSDLMPRKPDHSADDDDQNELEPHQIVEEEVLQVSQGRPLFNERKPDTTNPEEDAKNTTASAVGENLKRTQSEGLSKIAIIGISIGAIFLLWLLLCPVVCILCRRRDKKKEKEAEKYKMKNGVPAQQKHPLVDNHAALTELGLVPGDDANKPAANGKEKEYSKEALNAEELQSLSNSHSLDNSHLPAVANLPNRAPLASTENLDTEV